MGRWTVREVEPRALRAWQQLVEHNETCGCGRRRCGRRLELLREHARWQELLEALRRLRAGRLYITRPTRPSSPPPPPRRSEDERRWLDAISSIDETRARWVAHRRSRRRRGRS